MGVFTIASGACGGRVRTGEARDCHDRAGRLVADVEMLVGLLPVSYVLRDCSVRGIYCVPFTYICQTFGSEVDILCRSWQTHPSVVKVCSLFDGFAVPQLYEGGIFRLV